jgi:hypothetical protein
MSTVGFSGSTLILAEALYIFGWNSVTVNAVSATSRNTSSTITLRVRTTRQ